MNPFKYGKVVQEPYFVGRSKEISKIESILTGGNNLILYAPRRFGKTSLIKRVMRDLDKTVYLDFFGVTSRKSFIDQYVTKLLNTQKLPIKKIISKLQKILTGVSPSVTFDHLGNPNWNLSFSENQKQTDSLQEILDLPEKFSSSKQPLFVVFDEFQEINKLNGNSFEKELRAVIQNHQNVSYVFMGSKSHLIQNMFASKNRALYNSGYLFKLDKVDKNEMKEFLKSGFDEIADSIIEKLIEKTDNIPYYNQFLGAQLWMIINTDKNISHEQALENAVNSILENQNDFYLTLYDNLTAFQRSILSNLVEKNHKIFSYKFTKNIASPSSIQRAIQVLVEHGIIEKKENAYCFTDPFFAHWLKLRKYA